MIELIWNAPVSESKLASQLAALALVEGDTILDVGCGCGEVLLRICERHAVQATGIDSSAEHIAEARRRAAQRKLTGRVDFVEADAKQFSVEAESLDVVICLGASHAFEPGAGAHASALKEMDRMVQPGGRLLISAGYAQQPVPDGYQEFIGESITSDMTHESNVATGKSLGLVPLGAWTSTDDEWDEFEWSYQRIVEQRASSLDANEMAGEKLIQRRHWINGYLRWGRDTLGYGTYLFQKPQERSRSIEATREDDSLCIISYDAQYQSDFKRLNESWINEHFEMEESDHEVLNHPERWIIDSGGEILFAVVEETIAGTCALVKMKGGPFDFELAKMAVDPMFRGRGIGQKLGEAIIDRARVLGANRLFLESNTILASAISLYRKLGFTEIERQDTSYTRGNIHMVLDLAGSNPEPRG